PADHIGRWQIGSLETQPAAIAVLPSGQIVVAGNALDTGSSSFEPFVARFNSDGSLDTTFGNSGVFKFFFDAAVSSELANGMVVDTATGKIILAATLAPTGTNEIGVARINADGMRLDTTFNTTGIVISSNPAGLSRPGGLALDGNGSIVIGGQLQQGSPGNQQSDFYFLHLAADGSSMATVALPFLVNGVHEISRATGAAVEPDGTIILAGASGTSSAPGMPGTNNYALAGVDNQGNLDTSFGGTPLP